MLMKDLVEINKETSRLLWKMPNFTSGSIPLTFSRLIFPTLCNGAIIKNFSADTFVCSTNALTESGELYNIDGNGSRVAPMLYGPKQVILIVGINKIVCDIEEAEKRVRQYAAP